MKKRHFDVETDGFYGAYWKCKSDSGCAMIAMIGDDPEDYLARISVKWLHKLGVNVPLFLVTNVEYSYLSSSAVRELARYHGDVSLFVPPYVEQKLDEKLDSKENEHEQN